MINGFNGLSHNQVWQICFTAAICKTCDNVGVGERSPSGFLCFIYFLVIHKLKLCRSQGFQVNVKHRNYTTDDCWDSYNRAAMLCNSQLSLRVTSSAPTSQPSCLISFSNWHAPPQNVYTPHTAIPSFFSFFSFFSPPFELLSLHKNSFCFHSVKKFKERRGPLVLLLFHYLHLSLMWCV